MKNFVQPGYVITLIAPEALTAGRGFIVGSIFAVATSPAASGAAVEGITEGVVTLTKASAQSWSTGVRVYWDNTAKNVTTTATSNTLIGVAAADAANPSSTGLVRLNGSF